MKKEMNIYILAFALSGALAYWASLPSTAKDQTRTSFVNVNASQIASVEFASPELKVVMKPSADKKWWIETDKAGVKESFLGSSKVKEVFQLFSPLEAIRVIGSVKDDGLAEFGLNDSKKEFKILDQAGQPLLHLILGKQAFGTRNMFVLDSTSKKVLLVSGDLTSDIERPDTKLYERMITNVVHEEIQKAKVSNKEKSREFAHTKRDDKGMLLWTSETAEGATVVSAKSWFERLDRVRIVSFATPEEIAALDSAPISFSVDLESPSSKDSLKFAKRPTTATAAPAGTMDYFVKSDFLGIWAKVASSRVEPIEKDLGTVLSEGK
jgi:hypothetical protein